MAISHCNKVVEKGMIFSEESVAMHVGCLNNSLLLFLCSSLPASQPSPTYHYQKGLEELQKKNSEGRRLTALHLLATFLLPGA